MKRRELEEGVKAEVALDIYRVQTEKEFSVSAQLDGIRRDRKVTVDSNTGIVRIDETYRNPSRRRKGIGGWPYCVSFSFSDSFSAWR